MKKKIQLSILILSAIVLFSCSGNKEGFYEEDAIKALDNLTEVIGQLKSCSFTLNTMDSKSTNNEAEPERKAYDIYMRGSDKMHYYSEGNDQRIGHWYNGEELSVFNFNTDEYDIMDAPSTLVETIDLFHKDFRITFPAADFFYPSLTDDLIEHFDTITTVGTRMVEDVECVEINATNNNVDVYILIEKSTNLPKALALYYQGDRKGEQFISVFSNWRQDPNLPDDIFKFSPPENATKGSLLISKITK